jgi:3-oxoacyl-[acyl-carrier-protein] synthase III
MRPEPSHRFWQDARSVSLLGMGTALPGEPVSTAQLLERLHTRFQVDVRRQGMALAARLGVHTRHICRDLALRHEAPRAGDSNAELSARALRAALDESGIGPNDLSYLIAHTATPGRLLPANIARVADLIGYHGPFVELRQACTGFANALVFAMGLLHTPSCGPVAIVGSETGSVFFDPRRAAEDSGQLINLIQMGDGAAACVLASEVTTSAAQVSRVFHGYSGWGLDPGFSMTSGGSDFAPTGGSIPEFTHDYLSVAEHGTGLFVDGLVAARQLGINRSAVNYFIPHQANGHMARLLAAQIELDETRIFVNADRIGNTGSAAVWLALAELRTRLQAGDSVCVLGAEATKYIFGGFQYVHA